MSVIDDYLQKVPATQRAELDRVRQIVKAAVPEAEEIITYGMPGFKYHEKYLIAFAAFKDHLSVFPGAGAVATLEDELGDYKLSKGTVQFTLEHPLPEAIIRNLTIARQAAIIGAIQ